MPYLSREEARAFDLHDVTFTSFASTASGAVDIAAWRVDVPPETPGQPHTMSCEEVLHVLSGELHAEIDGEGRVVPAGDALLVPSGAVLRVGTGPEPASAWVTTLIGMTASMASGEEVTPPGPSSPDGLSDRRGPRGAAPRRGTAARRRAGSP